MSHRARDGHHAVLTEVSNAVFIIGFYYWHVFNLFILLTGNNCVFFNSGVDHLHHLHLAEFQFKLPQTVFA